MTGSKGDTKIDAGMSLSGETVAEHNGDNNILRLDIGDKNTTDKDIANQALFTVRNENVKDNLSDSPDGKGNLYDYFITRAEGKEEYGRVFGKDMKQRLNVNIGDVDIDVWVGIGFYGGDFGTKVDGVRFTNLTNCVQTNYDFNYPKSKKGKLKGRVMTINTQSGSKKASILRKHLEAKN